MVSLYTSSISYNFHSLKFVKLNLWIYIVSLLNFRLIVTENGRHCLKFAQLGCRVSGPTTGTHDIHHFGAVRLTLSLSLSSRPQVNTHTTSICPPTNQSCCCCCDRRRRRWSGSYIYKDDIITHRIGGPTCLAEKEEEAPRSGDFSL